MEGERTERDDNMLYLYVFYFYLYRVIPMNARQLCATWCVWIKE